MDFHSRRAAGDGGGIVFVQAFQVMQPDFCGVLGGNRRLGRADFQERHLAFGGGARFAGFIDRMKIARETALAAVEAVLDFEQRDVEFCVRLSRESQRPRDLHQANDGGAFYIIEHMRASADQHPVAGFGHAPRLPGFRIGPRTILHRMHIEIQMSLGVGMLSRLVGKQCRRGGNRQQHCTQKTTDHVSLP